MTAKRTVIRWRGGVPVQSYYEGARSDPARKQRRETGSADVATMRAGHSLREQARHLDQNYDIARGVLNILVQNNQLAPDEYVEKLQEVVDVEATPVDDQGSRSTHRPAD